MPYDGEKQMLREFFLHIGSYLCCYFCKKPLLWPFPRPDTFGHRRHNRVRALVTLHHLDENRENNADSNLAWCHSDCHKKHHREKNKCTSAQTPVAEPCTPTKPQTS